MEAKLDGFAARITGPLGVGGVLQAVEGVRSALDLGPQLEAFSARVESSLASSNEQTLDIEQIAAVGREASGELRELVTAAREASSSEVAGLAATFDERLRGVAEELGSRLDALARSAHEGNGDELETKLDGFAARLDGPLGIGGVLQAVDGLRGALDLEPQLDSLATRIESSLASSSDRTPNIEQKLSTIEARLEELRVVAFEPQVPVGLAEIVAAARETSSSEALGLAVMLDERLRGVVDEVGGRLDTLGVRAEWRHRAEAVEHRGAARGAAFRGADLSLLPIWMGLWGYSTSVCAGWSMRSAAGSTRWARPRPMATSSRSCRASRRGSRIRRPQRGRQPS